MAEYAIGDKVKIRRVDKDKLEINVSGNKAVVHTEDLAALVREELPNDRATELFSEIEEKMMQRGKARVVVRTHKDIKAGEEVCFAIDINRYIGDSNGIRVSPNGILF